MKIYETYNIDIETLQGYKLTPEHQAGVISYREYTVKNKLYCICHISM